MFNDEHEMLKFALAVITALTIINLVVLDVPDILRGVMVGLNLAIAVLVYFDERG